MSRDIERRLRLVEQALPVTPSTRKLTDEDRSTFVALDATVVAMLLGGFQVGDDPLQALYRGIEIGHAAADRVSPIRSVFAQRLRDAAAMSLNSSDSVAVPMDWFERSRAVADRPGAGQLMEAFGSLYFDHPGFAEDFGSQWLWTRIGADGVERYCYPERAGAADPQQRWCGQGTGGASAYWGGKTTAA